MKNLLFSRFLVSLLLFIVAFLVVIQPATATPTPTPTPKPTPTPAFFLTATPQPNSNDVKFDWSPAAISGMIIEIRLTGQPNPFAIISLSNGQATATWTGADGTYTSVLKDTAGNTISNNAGFSLPGPISTPAPTAPPGGSGGSGNLGTISPPPGLGGFSGTGGIQSLLRVIIQLLFIVGFIATFFCILISAISWIVSGGDKASIQQARGRITACIVGLVIMLSIFAIVNIIELVFGVNIFSGGLEIPRL